MSAFRIPLSPEPQSLTVSLGGVEYRLTVRWVEADEGGWLLDIATASSPDGGVDLVAGIPLVTGCDLLEPYDYLGIGGGLVVWADGSDLPPSLDNLGQGVELYFLTSEAA